MKKLLALPLLVFALSCQDATPMNPDLEASFEAAMVQAKGLGEVVKRVPLKGYGTWNYGPWGDLDCASDDGSTRVRHINEEYRSLTHLGNVTSEIYQCAANNPWGVPVVWAREVITAANGDQIFIFNPGPLSPGMIPEGSLWGLYLEVTGGTGRFEGATGDGIVHGTLDFVTMTGEFWVDAMISSVGSSK